MPTISVFYGIRISMNLSQKEHNPPHVHAEYGELKATFSIMTGDIIDGKFPQKGKNLVKEFILANKEQLKEMWDTEKYIRLPQFE